MTSTDSSMSRTRVGCSKLFEPGVAGGTEMSQLQPAENPRPQKEETINSAAAGQ
jgi:hypothetical protein